MFSLISYEYNFVAFKWSFHAPEALLQIDDWTFVISEPNARTICHVDRAKALVRILIQSSGLNESLALCALQTGSS